MKRVYSLLYRLGQKIFGGTSYKKLPFLRQGRNLLARKSRPDQIEVGGFKLFTDPILGIAAPEGVYEPETTAILKSHLKSGATMIDIGADIGEFTCLAAKLVGPKGKVYAFEPNPRSFTLLKKNVEANGLGWVKVFPYAVSEKEGTLPLYDNGPHSSVGFDRFGDQEKSVDVKSITLDSFLKDNPSVDFIKVDVEGSEPRVFRGMSGLIKVNPNLKVIMEFYPRLLVQAGEDPGAFLVAWQNLGFTFYDVSLGQPLTIPQLTSRYPSTENKMTNLFLENK